MCDNNLQKTVEYSWSDAWVLQAVAMAARRRPAGLKEVIAAGDAIMHAIFSFGELRTGLKKLIDAGYVVEETGRWSISSQFRSEYARLAKLTRSWVGVNEPLLEFLRSQPNRASSEQEKRTAPLLSQADYEEAVRQYTHPVPLVTRLKSLLRWR